MRGLLKLPEQLDRDAAMVLHLGGTLGNKAVAIKRFKTDYVGLSASNYRNGSRRLIRLV